MRKHFLSYLSDPETRKPFKLTVFAMDGDHVDAGVITTDSTWHPIIHGIPRILIGDLKEGMLQFHHAFLKEWKEKLPANAVEEWEKAIAKIENFDRFLKHQKKTAESFAFEWKTIYRENDFEKQNFLHFLSPFIKEKQLKGKVTLDIGCGSGRFTKQAALCGAEVAFGSDLGESVEVAYALTKDLPQVCIVQADIYDMPFHGVADVAYSIGVLHHLPQPQEGFSRLPKTLKKDGKMLIWVYNRRNNARAIYFYEPLRAVLKHMPKRPLVWLCYPPALAVHAINGVTHLLNKFGAKQLAKKVPFSYYANFPFNMKLNDAFDVLATPKSNYYYIEEIERWFNSAKLKDVDAYEHPEAGITCIGRHAS